MLLLLVLAIPAQRVLAQTPAASNETCSTAVLVPNLRTETAFESQSAAQQVSAPTLASYDKGYVVSFNSLSNQFTWTKSCSVIVQSVNVAYELTSQAANYTLLISLSPSLTTVTGVSEYPAQIAGSICYTNGGSGSGCPPTNPGWVGPEYYNSGGITQANSDWEIPSVLGANGQICTCGFLQWTGLAGSPGGYNTALAQAGTEIKCNYPCSSSSPNAVYSYWYDFANGTYAILTPCTNDPNIAAGDLMSSDIYDSSGTYHADVFDNTHSVGCDGTPASHYSGWTLGTAYYAEYMGEWNTGLGQLPDFSQFSFTSSEFVVGGTSQYISNSWAYAYIIDETSMANNCDGNSDKYNVCPSGVDSTTGTFSLTYVTGDGT
jgi:hypothetical protein